MIRSVFYFLGFIFFQFLVISCNNIKNEKAIANSFYIDLQQKSYDKIIPLIDSSALAVSPKETWTGLFEEKNKNFGKIISFENIAFYSKNKDNNKLTKLKFKVKFEKKTLYESLEIQSLNNNTPKILHYEYYENDFELLKED